MKKIDWLCQRFFLDRTKVGLHFRPPLNVLRHNTALVFDVMLELAAEVLPQAMKRSTMNRAIFLECGTDYMRAVACDRRIMALHSIPKGTPYVGNFRLPTSGAGMVTELDGDLATLSFYKNAIGISVS